MSTTNSALEQRTNPPAPATRVSQATAIEQSRAVAEVQAAIVVAQQCPRDMRRAWADMREACSRLSLASRAFYKVPNRGSGKSVHLATELARIWGNLDYGVKELRRDDATHESEVQAYAWDQQTNVRSTRSLVVPHARMAGGERKPLIDLTDVNLNNQNAGARAMRECIFKILPADFAAEAAEICRNTLEKGDGQPLEKRIASMIAVFGELGVKVGQMEAKLGRKRGQWSGVDIADMQVVYSSIKSGEVRASDEFPQERVTVDEIMGAPAVPLGAAFNARAKPVSDDRELMPHEWDRARLVARIDELFALCEIDDWARYASGRLGIEVHELSALSDQQLANLMVALTSYAEQLEPPGGAE